MHTYSESKFALTSCFQSLLEIQIVNGKNLTRLGRAIGRAARTLEHRYGIDIERRERANEETMTARKGGESEKSELALFLPSLPPALSPFFSVHSAEIVQDVCRLTWHGLRANL